MKRQNPFFSPLGCLGALIMLIGLGAALLLTGGTAFNPGALSAQADNQMPLSGAASHVTFETQCSQCHLPFLGISGEKCLACHSVQAGELNAGEGLHGRLLNGRDCAACHTDHRGRDFRISQADPIGLDHQSVGYSLVAHKTNYNQRPFACRDCHQGQSFIFDQQACTDCHAAADAAFMAEHTGLFGLDCLSCHDGKDSMANFDHGKAFSLTGGHADLTCERCHSTGFTGASAECAACHEEPQIHAGKFGLDCGNCHATTAWQPARLVNHSFPLNHGEQGEVACATCHQTDYVSYTCYGCHEHTPAGMQRKHLKEGIRNYQNCVQCHASGREEESGD